MMNSPPVKVTLLDDFEPKISVSLGDQAIDTILERMMNHSAKKGTPFLLEWHGSRVPRGAKIKGHEVAWTQHGVVRRAGGAILGYYERVLDKPSPNDQVMVVWLTK